MDVKLSIREEDVGMNNPIKEEVKKDGMDLFKEEEIWWSRRKRIKNALAAARAAARQDPADLYAAASGLVDVIKRADVEEFISEIERLADQTDLSATFNFQGLPRGSLLHIAAHAGKGDILWLLLDNVPDHFVANQDDWGNTPLHIATKAKAIGVVDMLIGWVKDLPNVEEKLLLRMKNNHGNTALHEAVLTRDVGLVRHLLGEYPEPVYWKNVDQKSPLYLALDTGNSEIPQVLFTYLLEPSKIEGMPPVHGAIRRCNYVLVAKILKWSMKLFAMTDSGGGNVFHLAAYMNQIEAFEFLQPKTEYLARERDNNGDLPIHIACKRGNVALIKKLHPVSQLVNGQGRTILHVAANYGRALAVRYMLKHPDLGEMINERDHDGNTPSHLAAKYLQPAVLLHLVLDERMNPSLLNDERLAAVDIVRDNPRTALRKLLALTLLEGTSAKRSDLIVLKPEARDKAFMNRGLVNTRRLRDNIDTLLLVATIVTTVTFAAGFTVPGGFNGSDMTSKDDRGMPTMLDNIMFQAFVICNTIAMFCSMTSVVGFMLAYMMEVHLSVVGSTLAGVLLATSLPAMSAAFLIGVTLTVGKLPWLATAILIMGSIFILIITGALFSPGVIALLISPFLFDRLRPIRPLISRFILAFLWFFHVGTSILDDPKEDRTRSKASAGPPLGGGGED